MSHIVQLSYIHYYNICIISQYVILYKIPDLTRLNISCSNKKVAIKIARTRSKTRKEVKVWESYIQDASLILKTAW